MISKQDYIHILKERACPTLSKYGKLFASIFNNDCQLYNITDEHLFDRAFDDLFEFNKSELRYYLRTSLFSTSHRIRIDSSVITNHYADVRSFLPSIEKCISRGLIKVEDSEQVDFEPLLENIDISGCTLVINHVTKFTLAEEVYLFPVAAIISGCPDKEALDKIGLNGWVRLHPNDPIFVTIEPLYILELLIQFTLSGSNTLEKSAINYDFVDSYLTRSQLLPFFDNKLSVSKSRENITVFDECGTLKKVNYDPSTRDVKVTIDDIFDF